MAKVLIKKLDPAVELPAYKTEGASGMDLMALVKEPINLKPNSSCLVPTGLAVAFSSDFEIQIRPRSGLAKPDLGLICISKSLENATASPVGTKHDEFGLRLIGSFTNAIKSIPDAPSVL